MSNANKPDDRVAPSSGREDIPLTGRGPTPSEPQATMIFVSGGLDSLSGAFAIDDDGNWIGHEGEVVKFKDEDMSAAVERMRKRR